MSKKTSPSDGRGRRAKPRPSGWRSQPVVVAAALASRELEAGLLVEAFQYAGVDAAYAEVPGAAEGGEGVDSSPPQQLALTLGDVGD
jgi:hypothetical protein